MSTDLPSSQPVTNTPETSTVVSARTTAPTAPARRSARSARLAQRPQSCAPDMAVAGRTSRSTAGGGGVRDEIKRRGATVGRETRSVKSRVAVALIWMLHDLAQGV